MMKNTWCSAALGAVGLAPHYTDCGCSKENSLKQPKITVFWPLESNMPGDFPSALPGACSAWFKCKMLSEFTFCYIEEEWCFPGICIREPSRESWDDVKLNLRSQALLSRAQTLENYSQIRVATKLGLGWRDWKSFSGLVMVIWTYGGLRSWLYRYQ